MTKQELIEKYEYELKLLRLQFGEILRTKIYEELLDYLKQLDEPQKPVVPQFVANYIEYTKENEWDLLEAMNNVAYEDDKDLRTWFNNNAENFAQSWLDGYEVEKEKRYQVKMKGMNCINGYLAYNKINGAWYFGISGNSKNHSTNHTHKELEEAGFGWVFDCPGIEIEEVEE